MQREANSSENIVIRPAGRDDLPGILSLYHDLNAEDLDAPLSLKERTFIQMLAQPGLSILLALLDGEPVATITVVVVPNLTRGCASYALLENVATLSSCRGKGIGGRLLAEAIDLCWKADCYKIMLMSGSQNLRAHRFYQDRGFKTTKTGFELRKPGYPVRKIR